MGTMETTNHFINGRKNWDVQIPQSFLVVQKNLKTKSILNDAKYFEDATLQIKCCVYEKLRKNFSKAKRIMCNNLKAPKWRYILCLTIENKRLIRNRLTGRMTVANKKCPLCCSEDESIDYLFFCARML